MSVQFKDNDFLLILPPLSHILEIRKELQERNIWRRNVPICHKEMAAYQNDINI